MNKFGEIVPILNVNDFAASMEYYVNKLGFERKWDWGEPPTFGCVQRGDAAIFLCQGYQGKPGMWMQIFLNDVDELYEEYKKSGVIILESPMNFPWNTREMLVEDLDGHRFRMGSEATGPVDEAVLKGGTLRSQNEI